MFEILKNDLSICDNEECYLLFYFTAKWCSPCQKIKPLLEKISEGADKSKLKICIVCDQTIQPTYLGKSLDDPNEDVYWYEGNNAEPLAAGRCCDKCNSLVVAQRITDIRMDLASRNDTK